MDDVGAPEAQGCVLLLDLPPDLLDACLAALPARSLARSRRVDCAFRSAVQRIVDDDDPVPLLRETHLLQMPVAHLRVQWRDRHSMRGRDPTAKNEKYMLSRQCARLLRNGLPAECLGADAAPMLLVARFPPSMDQSWYEAKAQSCEWRGGTLTVRFDDGDIANELACTDVAARVHAPRTLADVFADDFRVVVIADEKGGRHIQNRWHVAKVVGAVLAEPPAQTSVASALWHRLRGIGSTDVEEGAPWGRCDVDAARAWLALDERPRVFLNAESAWQAL